MIMKNFGQNILKSLTFSEECTFFFTTIIQYFQKNSIARCLSLIIFLISHICNDDETFVINKEETETINGKSEPINVEETELINESDINLVIKQKKIEIITLSQLNIIFNFDINETNSKIEFIQQASDQYNSICQQTDQIYEKNENHSQRIKSPQTPIELHDF